LLFFFPAALHELGSVYGAADASVFIYMAQLSCFKTPQAGQVSWHNSVADFRLGLYSLLLY